MFRRKLLIAAALIALIATSMSIGALAATSMEKITAYLNKGITFKLNGSTWTPKDSNGKVIYPITYNNTTYLPVRAVSEATGIKINWDGKTQTISMETGGSGSSSGSGGSKNTSNPSAVGASRSNPAPIGTTVRFTTDDYFVGQVSGSLRVEEVIRGQAAWKALLDANPYNDPPEQGFEYILAKIYVKVDEVEKSDSQYFIDQFSFTLVSGSGKDYKPAIVLEPEPQLDAQLYEGGSHTGWVAFQVEVNDSNPLIAFGRHWDGSGGYWFKTN